MFLEKLLILLQIKNFNKFALLLILFLYSCSNFSFVYNNNEGDKEFFNAEIIVSGSDADVIKKLLSSKFLSNQSPKNYRLTVNSKLETKSVVIENDQTASTVEIKYILDYNLFNYKKNCNVVKESVGSFSTYNSRAEGYNFGSDLSKEQVSKQVIQDNINKFINQINTKGNELGCIDEG
tara:strand:- start:118 stop:654 length:537 start_codon:yes stop_codon:yes gene_type:complete